MVFFSGFALGSHADGRHGSGRWGDRDAEIFHRGGPPPMLPMGPRGDFERPPLGGPGVQSPQSPNAPTTSAPARP